MNTKDSEPSSHSSNGALRPDPVEADFELREPWIPLEEIEKSRRHFFYEHRLDTPKLLRGGLSNYRLSLRFGAGAADENLSEVLPFLKFIGDPELRRTTLLRQERGTKKPTRTGYQTWTAATYPIDEVVKAITEGGNLAVLTGPASDHLCTIDIDSGDLIIPFCAANPWGLRTLHTKGAKGCNFWFRLTGTYQPGAHFLWRTRNAGNSIFEGTALQNHCVRGRRPMLAHRNKMSTPVGRSGSAI